MKKIKSERLPVIAIGPTISGSKGQITGQAMMFQLLIDVLCKKNWPVKVYNIADTRETFNLRINASFTILRMLDYIKLIPVIWLRLLFARKSLVYLTIAQSKMGFLRDILIIWGAFLHGHLLICQQFGGYYSTFYNTQNRFTRFLIRRTLSLATRIIVEGEVVKEQFTFLDDHNDKICSVPNGLPERSIKAAKKAKTYARAQPFKMIFLSNMIETKGYWDVLKAVEILRNKQRNIKCHFIGKFMSAFDAAKHPDPKDAREAFFNYIEKKGLKDYISYSEGLLGQDKAKAFKESNLFLLPSNYLYEGQPVSILEAMAYGVVTIATDYRLIPTMVENNHTGFFVKYGDHEAIAAKVEYLMDYPEEYKKLSLNSIRRFQEYFRPECYVDRMIKVFQSAIQQ